ncbi:MAG: CotH kinase family protein [Coriobacteriales bacterium]|nr:CotH kinase family protein [Coriobacteriales bacterium]
MVKRLLGIALATLLLLVPGIASAHDMPDNGIPVVSITIDGGDEEFNKMNTSKDRTYQCGGTISLLVPNGYADSCGLADPTSLEDLKLDYIRGRGNSTWDSAGGKNPYHIKLNKSKALLGSDVGANKHWVLLTSPIDTSSLRNRLVAYMGAQLGFEFVPAGIHVDLVVNGTYRGSYYLAEQVRVGKSRVNIAELEETDVSEPQVTGGYLFSMTPKKDEPAQNRFSTSRGVEFCGQNPEFDPATSGTNEQKAYLADYLQKLEDAIWSNGAWKDLMDAESAAKYWWVMEFTKNQDAYITPSTYLHKKRDGKLYWGPLWDFDQSMGVPSGDDEGFGDRPMDWLDFVRAYDSDYQQLLGEVWAKYDGVLDDILHTGGILDRLANEVQLSWQADFDLWVRDTPSGPYAQSFDEEVESLRAWMSNRRDWIGAHVDTELTEVFGKVSFMVDQETLSTEYVRLGQYLYTLPDPPLKEGQVFLGWATGDGELVDEAICVQKDVVLHARYAAVSEAALGTDLFLRTYDLWVCVGDKSQLGFSVVPADAQEKYPAWSSSDVAVAEISAYGVVDARQVGIATITGTLANGATESVVVHVVASENEISTSVEAIYLSDDTLVLNAGEYAQMAQTILPQANDVVLPNYRVEDKGVATVDQNGVVHGVAPGTTTVHLCDVGDPDVVYASYTVIVEDDGQGEAEPASANTQTSTSTTQNAEPPLLQRSTGATMPRTADTTFAWPALLAALGTTLLLVRRKLV